MLHALYKKKTTKPHPFLSSVPFPPKYYFYSTLLPKPMSENFIDISISASASTFLWFSPFFQNSPFQPILCLSKQWLLAQKQRLKFRCQENGWTWKRVIMSLAKEAKCGWKLRQWKNQIKKSLLFTIFPGMATLNIPISWWFLSLLLKASISKVYIYVCIYIYVCMLLGFHVYIIYLIVEYMTCVFFFQMW